MKEIKRYSPIEFKATPLKSEQRNNWNVILKYKDEGEGPYLVDLSHRTRLDLQSSDLGSKKPFKVTIPDHACHSILKNGLLVNKMNSTQVSIYDLSRDKMIIPAETEYTDVTESTAFFALLGKNILSICEKLSSLDFGDPDKKAPFLFQGLFSHVPCQIVLLSSEENRSGIVITCSRGYARDMTHAILHAGKEFDLKPAGEEKFTNYIKDL